MAAEGALAEFDVAAGSVVEADLYPPGRADLVVCNPPWLPGEPTSDLEVGIYDPASDMLRRFLAGLAEHLEPGGQGWLVISDIAERLGLRSRDDLLGWVADAGLQVVDPAEDWLLKVVREEVFVDVLWRTCGRPVESALIDRADVLPVLSVQMPVLAATDVLITKLMALDEHYCDFARLLPVARALREQVDWPLVEQQVAANDFAVVFLQLLGRLDVVPGLAAG